MLLLPPIQKQRFNLKLVPAPLPAQAMLYPLITNIPSAIRVTRLATTKTVFKNISLSDIEKGLYVEWNIQTTCTFIVQWPQLIDF